MSDERKIRMWPLYAILAFDALVVIYFTLIVGSNARQDSMFRLIALFALNLFVLIPIWWMFLSNLAWKTRFKGLGVAVVAGALFLATFEIREVSGDVVPIFTPRWAQSHDDLTTDLGGDQPAQVEVGPNDFPNYLGPNFNSTVNNVTLSRDWSEPPKELWRITVGAGWSGFSIQGNLAVTQEQRGGQEMVTCYRLDTGEAVWGAVDEASYNSPIGGDGPRATPTLFDGKVYTFGVTGLLTCLNLADGEKIWQQDTATMAAATAPAWGYASSPVIVGDLVYAVPGGADGKSLMAFNRHDGSLAWQVGDQRAGYATPRLMTIAGVSQLVVFYLDAVESFVPETGELLWSTPWGEQKPTAANPLQLADNQLLISSGYGVGANRYTLSFDGSAWTVNKDYHTMRFKAKFANPVFYAGKIFGLDDGTMTAIDPEDGSRVWKRGRYGHGQLLLVGDLILLQSEKGTLHLLEANPEEHVELASTRVLGGKAWNTMAMSNNLLLMRNHKEAVLLELPVEEANM